MKKISLIVFVFCLIGCSEDKIDTSLDQEPVTQLDSIYTVASDFYYWNNYLPGLAAFDFETYNTPGRILDAFRMYSPENVDQWSFAIGEEEWQKLSQGIAGDFGFLLRFFDTDDLRVAYVHNNSPAGQAGIKRGFQILKLNDVAASSANLAQLENELSTASVIAIEYVTDEGIQSELTLNRSEYTIDAILNFDTYTYEGSKVGYLNVVTFSVDATAKFLEIFADFKAQGVEYLIVDLRYNGGGVLSFMERLANHMVCSDALNELMYETVYNDVYESFGTKKFFHEEANAICLKKISFITTESTASASEVLISALKPYTDISVIGTPTNGKLMGMHVIPYADFTLVPVAFQILNRDGFHDNFNGIIPDVQIRDGVDKNWGIEEACIQAALQDMIGAPNARAGLLKSNVGIANDNNHRLVGSMQVLTGAY